MTVILIWTQGNCNVHLYGSIIYTYAVTVMGQMGFPARVRFEAGAYLATQET